MFLCSVVAIVFCTFPECLKLKRECISKYNECTFRKKKGSAGSNMGGA